MSLDQPADLVKHETQTRDAFLGGMLTLSQPRTGFRAGLDSVLLGAAVSPERRKLLDMGAGVGTAGLIALAHNTALSATLAELDASALAMAHDNIEANGFAARATAIAVDVTAKGSDRRMAGLAENAYDSVIANPPFFGAGTLATDSSRAAARHMDAAALDLWVKTAAGSAAPGAEVIFIYPAAALPGLLAAFDQRFGAITILPLLPRPGEAATRVLIRGIKGSRAPLTLLASRQLHVEGRDFAAEFDAIFRGTSRLVW